MVMNFVATNGWWLIFRSLLTSSSGPLNMASFLSLVRTHVPFYTVLSSLLATLLLAVSVLTQVVLSTSFLLTEQL